MQLSSITNDSIDSDMVSIEMINKHIWSDEFERGSNLKCILLRTLMRYDYRLTIVSIQSLSNCYMSALAASPKACKVFKPSNENLIGNSCAVMTLGILKPQTYQQLNRSGVPSVDWMNKEALSRLRTYITVIICKAFNNWKTNWIDSFRRSSLEPNS